MKDKTYGIRDSGVELFTAGSFLLLLRRASFRAVRPFRRKQRIGRNQKCDCGSNKKHKYCCGKE